MKISKAALTLTVVGLVGLAMAYPDADLVTSLEQMDDISFGLYSGYVPLTGTKKKLHYVATLSRGNKLTDPIIIWFNGGPGCSSMLGFSQENGPYALNDADTIFRKNDYAWNQQANVIYLESPAGVGYSVCEDPTECKFNDDNSGDDNRDAVLALLQKFPEIMNNDLYIAGESYAGIYIPKLVKRLDTFIVANKDNKDIYKPNLKGFMVGNGVTNWKYDADPAFVEQAYWFGIADDELYFNMKTCDYSYMNFDGDKLSDECKGYMATLNSYMKNIQPYDLFGKCYYFPPKPSLQEGAEYLQSDDGLTKHANLQAEELEFRKKFRTVVDYASFKFRNQPNYMKLKDDIHCGTYDGPLLDYFNKASVKASLKIDAAVTNFELCTTNPLFDYTMSREATFSIYQELTQTGKYRILKYSGDSDGVLPTQGTQNWIRELNLKPTVAWKSWSVGGQTSGYVTEYENNFTFATIHGAGHMAPQWKRKETYHVIFTFLAGGHL